MSSAAAAPISLEIPSIHSLLPAPLVPKRLRKAYRLSHNGCYWVRRCSRCQRWHPASAENFVRSKSSPTGLGWLCLACNSAAQKRWQASHKAETMAQQTRHRERRKQAAGKFTAADRRALLVTFGHCCAACGVHQSQLPTPLHADHIVPPPAGSNSNGTSGVLGSRRRARGAARRCWTIRAGPRANATLAASGSNYRAGLGSNCASA